MSQTQYAAHRGCSRSAVQKAIDRGIITYTKGKIDSDQADPAWEIDPAHAITGVAPYREARAVRQHFMALREKQAYLLETKQLVHTDDVLGAIGPLLSAAKNRLLAMGNKLAPTLIHESDPAIIQTTIENEVEQAFSELQSYRL